jgi:AraC family transcriptional regulator, transcriptional activator FtrA
MPRSNQGGGPWTGFGSADALRHHFRIRLGTSPARYRAAFQAPARSRSSRKEDRRRSQITP